MSQEYAITWVGNPREWSTSRGDRMLSYEVEVDGVTGKIEWARKPESDPPTIGAMTPLATIDNGAHGKKLKVDWNAVKEQKAGRPSSSTSSAGSANLGGGDYARPLRPEVQRAIQRQHSQEMALRALALLKLPQVPDGTELKALIAHWTGWFDADVDRETTPQGSGEGSLGPQTSAPAQSPVVDISEIEEALQGAHVSVENSHLIGNYMALKLEPSRTIEAIRKLTDFTDVSGQKRAVDALKKLTEADIGHALLADTPPEDDIPF